MTHPMLARPEPAITPPRNTTRRELQIPIWQKAMLYLGATLAVFLTFRLVQVMAHYDWADLGGVVMLAHAGVALLASVLTAWMLLSPKGTPLHKITGRLWSAMLLFIAISSFWLRDGFGAAMGIPFGIGPIHLLSGITIFAVISGIVAIRRGNVKRHVSQMVTVCWALLIAGAFTLMPGRLMQQLAFFTL